MHILSINIGAAQPLENTPSSALTGIDKLPVSGPVQVTRDGLPGDAIISTRHHGGPDQALYLYGEPDYAWWAGELGRPLPAGTFGENLTVSGLESGRLNIGDRLRIGEALLEVTAPRIPCDTFAQQVGEPDFVARFRAAERPGAYCRVIRPGLIAAGQAVTFEPTGETPVALVEIYRDYYQPDRSLTTLRRFLDAPVAERFREALHRRYREMLRCEG